MIAESKDNIFLHYFIFKMAILSCIISTYVLFLVFHSHILLASHIEVGSDGGYTKIVVAISPRENQSPKLLKNLQELLSDSSEKLYSATRNRLFFQEIQILVPNSWSQDDGSSYPEATFESYFEADIRVDRFNPLEDVKGNLYTQQPRGCGEKGDFIYVKPTFVENWEHIGKNFVQEWSKLRYGLFDEHGLKTKLYPIKYPSGEEKFNRSGCLSIMDDASVENEYCDNATKHQHNKFAPTPQNALCKLKDSWSVVTSSPDLENILPKDNHLSTINFNIVRMSPMQVVFVIDPYLCQSIGQTEPHMLELTLRQFLTEFPTDGKIRFVIADGRNEELNLEESQSSGHVDKFTKFAKTANVTTRDIMAGLKKGIKMLLGTPQNGHLILVSDGPKLRSSDFKSVFIHLAKLTFFLLTWTPVKSNLLHYDENDMKEFVKNPTRCLWMDIRVATSIDDCDIAARIQIEDALALFYAKFGNEDFYPKKIKIHEDSGTSINSTNYLVSPHNSATLIFNTYFCDITANDTQLSLKINDVVKLVIDLSKQVKSTFSATYTLPNADPKIVYQFDLSKNHTQHNKLASSVWLLTEKYTQPKTVPTAILTGQIEEVSTSLQFGSSPPMVYYVLNSKSYALTAEMTRANGCVFNIDLWDSGNGDPDVLAEDKIFSRYFFNYENEDQVYSVRIIAKDSDNNITLQQSLGSVYVKSTDISQFPPNRIGDFHFDEPSLTALLLWTAPGGALDKGSASAYYIKCDSDFQNITTIAVQEIVKNQEKLTITPLESGKNESFKWQIPSANIVYYCVIISENEYGKNSEKSNIASIFIHAQRNTTTLPTTEESDWGNNDTSHHCDCKCTGELTGIGILTTLVIILIGIVVYLVWKIGLENVFQNRVPNFQSKSPPGLDKIELNSNPTNQRKTNDYQTKRPSTPKPEQKQKQPSFKQEQRLPSFKPEHPENRQSITGEPIYDDVAIPGEENCVYEKINDLSGSSNSNSGGDNKQGIGRKGISSLPPKKDPLPALPSQQRNNQKASFSGKTQ